MNDCDRLLLDRVLEGFGAAYDEAEGLLEDGEEGHPVRESAYYALALLMAGGADEKAAKIIASVIGTQYTESGTVYYGTYKRTIEEIDPPADPVVWKDYDPNWREFIALAFAAILAEFPERLPPALVGEMKESARRAVVGAVERYIADDTPLNTNIEIMHVFAADFFGRLLGDDYFLSRARIAADALYGLYARDGSVSEFNSATYYGVDFIALACIRKYCGTGAIRAMAAEIDDGLWSAFSDFYSPSLGNLSGPYSRCYEMEMTAHSSLGSIFYRSLGDDFRRMAASNGESFDDAIIILADVKIPERLREKFAVEGGERLVTRRFTELCERHPKGGRHFPCTATAWIVPDFMIGALDGSRNTSGQLHPATVFWNHRGGLYWIRLSRRRPGGHWSRHFGGIRYRGTAERGRLLCGIDLSGSEPIEVFLEFCGRGIKGSVFEGESWKLPGFALSGRFGADDVRVREAGDRLEMFATYPGGTPVSMYLVLEDFRLGGEAIG